VKEREFSLEVFLFTLARNFLHAAISYDMGLWLYFPSEGSVLWIFITLKNPSPRLGLNP
jgi:hypothetical protein